MKNIENSLKNWLSLEVDDEYFKEFVETFRHEIENNFSRGEYLKLKNCDRLVGRNVLEQLVSCNHCSSIKTIDDALSLTKNDNYKGIQRPEYLKFEFKYQGVTGPNSYWQCNKCGSITMFVLPERAFKGWWGKVA